MSELCMTYLSDKISEIAQSLEGKSGFFSKDILVNFEDIKNKPILVLGYSGSGKTPVAKSLARKFNRELVSTDDIWWDLQKNGALKTDNAQNFNNMLQELIYAKGEIVIEGVHLFDIFKANQERFFSMPLVLLGTNVYLSTLKAFARDGILKKEFLFDKYRKNTKEIRNIFNDILNVVEALPKQQIQKVKRGELL